MLYVRGDWEAIRNLANDRVLVRRVGRDERQGKTESARTVELLSH
jgi:hypothetical protein